DTRRYQDFRQLRTAVNQYRSDKNAWPGNNSENVQVSRNCTGVDIYTDLVDGGYLNSMPTDPQESVVACNNVADIDFSDKDDYYYAWDYTEADDNRRACFGINTFESTSDAGSLEDLNQVNTYQGGGGNGDLWQGAHEFIYCFEN
ncbi:MAG: hypothetical protein BRC25_00835, partial [Parcubacteria group bacterium SW_6_46_9]